MLRAAFRDPGIVAAFIVLGLGMPTLGSGLAVLATVAVAPRPQHALLAAAIILIVFGALITAGGVLALIHLIRALAKERSESLAFVTEQWNARYLRQSRELLVGLVFDKTAECDVVEIGVMVVIDNWDGWLEGDLVQPHMRRKYRYVVQFRGNDIDVPVSFSTIPVHVKMVLRDGVKKEINALVALTFYP